MSGAGLSHDAFFKRLMAEPDAAGALLRERLPPAVVALLAPDPPELIPGSFVDAALTSHLSDLLYRVRTRDGEAAFIYVLIEHKSSPEPKIALQLLRYMVRIWERAEAAGEDPLPVIVPLIVCHGRAGWTVPEDFPALLRVPEALLPYVPAFRYVLADLGRIDDAGLSDLAVLRAGLLALKYVLREDLPRRLAEMLAPLAGENLEITVTLLRYVLSGPGRLQDQELRRAIWSALPGEEARIMSTLTDQWVEQGLEKGLERGRAEGRAEGRAMSLTRLLERRFGRLPAALRARIDSADADTLDRWLDRVLDAADLDGIFAP